MSISHRARQHRAWLIYKDGGIRVHAPVSGVCGVALTHPIAMRLLERYREMQPKETFSLIEVPLHRVDRDKTKTYPQETA